MNTKSAIGQSSNQTSNVTVRATDSMLRSSALEGTEETKQEESKLEESKLEESKQEETNQEETKEPI